MGGLEDQVAVVTGASSGIGEAAARCLAQDGASVVLTARRAERLEAVAADIEDAGGQALAVPADLTREADVTRLHDEAIERFDRVDILVNNAGVGAYGSIEETSVEDFDRMMAVNMRATFLATRAFLPAMKERGHGQVCFVASVAGLRGLPGESAYCASKFAQVGFAQALDHETRDRGVKISVVAPGGVRTEFAFGAGRTPGDPALDRMLAADDVAGAIHFALTQPDQARSFLVGLRPMSEPL